MESYLSDILLIEDDVRLAELTADYLRQNGFSVAIESNGACAVETFHRCKAQLVLLDLSLPEKDGLDICRELRIEFNGPIILLTARDTNLDQVIGLEAGADDYINKPAEPMVLLARVRALLRRQSNFQGDVQLLQREIIIGDLAIHCHSRQVYLYNEEVKLSGLEFELLRLLAENPGTLLSRDRLHLEARGVEYDGLNRSVDIRIAHLRKKLGDDLDNPRRIKTVWGKGYLLAPDMWQ